MTLTLALGAGLLIGISLGALGGGGSILTVPALVYVLGEPAAGATTASLVIVGITALAGGLGHARAGRVRWGMGTAFALAGVLASVAGTALNRAVPANALLLAFAGLMVVAAIGMLAQSARPALAGAKPEPARNSPRAVAGKVVLAGVVVGFLTGFLGVGGGFVVVPALVLALRYPMPVAVGTSLLVIAINSVAALLARAGTEQFHWALIVPFTLAAIAGSYGGKLVADRVPGPALTRAFGALLIVVAGYVMVRTLTG